jgi:TrmH family RNA methyltransferase
MKHIASRENPHYKALARLCHSARERRKAQRSVLEGMHLVQAYAQRFGSPEELIVSDAGLPDEEIAEFLAAHSNVRQVSLTAALFNDLCQVASPTGLIAIVQTPTPGIDRGCRFALLLEDIQDPGNLGTMLRTAAAAGVERVYLSSGCAFAWSAKTLRAGPGAHFFIDIVEGADLLAEVSSFKGTVVAAEPAAGVSLFDVDLGGPLAFLIGNEGAGLSDALLASATHRVAIPMPGGMESLNAAIATAVCLFEKVRQDSGTP